MVTVILAPGNLSNVCMSQYGQPINFITYHHRPTKLLLHRFHRYFFTARYKLHYLYRVFERLSFSVSCNRGSDRISLSLLYT